MPSIAMHSFLTKLFVAPFGTVEPLGAVVDANVNWTRIAEVISVSGLGMENGVTRITHLSSDGRAHEKVPGILDGGQVTFKVNYTAANLVGLLQRLPGGGTGGINDALLPATPSWGRFQWLLQFPEGSQWYCTGFIKSFPVDVPEDDRITCEVTVEISGRPSFTGI